MTLTQELTPMYICFSYLHAPLLLLFLLQSKSHLGGGKIKKQLWNCFKLNLKKLHRKAEDNLGFFNAGVKLVESF